jgi:hypothetical protein
MAYEQYRKGSLCIAWTKIGFKVRYHCRRLNATHIATHSRSSFRCNEHIPLAQRRGAPASVQGVNNDSYKRDTLKYRLFNGGVRIETMTFILEGERNKKQIQEHAYIVTRPHSQVANVPDYA